MSTEQIGILATIVVLVAALFYQRSQNRREQKQNRDETLAKAIEKATISTRDFYQLQGRVEKLEQRVDLLKEDVAEIKVSIKDDLTEIKATMMDVYTRINQHIEFHVVKGHN